MQIIFLITSTYLSSFSLRVLSPQCNLLRILGNSLPFECAIGLNGRIWINGRSNRETIAIVNAIHRAEYLSNDECTVMVKSLVNSLSGF